MGEGFRLGGVAGRCGIGPNDSIPGNRSVVLCCCGTAKGSGAATGLSNCDGVTTLLKRLLGLTALKLVESGCQVRRRQSSVCEVDSRLEENTEDVGDPIILLLGENGGWLEAFGGTGPNRGRPRLVPWGDWNGIPPDGTLSRRPGVLWPEYIG